MSKEELHPRTAIFNKNQKNRSKQLKLDALQWLAAHFPASFDNSIRIRPFKKGIMTDILLHAEEAEKEGISRAKLREAVVIFTRRLDYLACLKARERRVDLMGNDVEEVTPEEAEIAAAKIRKRVEKSARNARKLITDKSPNKSKTQANSNFVKNSHYATQVQDDYLPTYPARTPTYAANVPPAKTTPVLVKHKTTKQYDPSAVARLKEKLGLSRATENKTEAAVE